MCRGGWGVGGWRWVEVWVYHKCTHPTYLPTCSKLVFTYVRAYTLHHLHNMYSQVQQLSTLIGLLLGELSKGERQKIMSICTIDVHARDVVAKLIAQKVDNSQAFTWLSQLRHRWDEEQRHCFANICDAQFKYSYEYLGNTARLVITPLTDRLEPACNWTHLYMICVHNII